MERLLRLYYHAWNIPTIVGGKWMGARGEGMGALWLRRRRGQHAVEVFEFAAPGGAADAVLPDGF
jgi:hypothetical protein